MRRIVLKLLKLPIMARQIVRTALHLHNFSYKVAGTFSIVLEPGLLHPKHRLMNYHQWFVENLDPEWDILDAGCGNGALAYDMKPFCNSVVAVDINPDNIVQAKEKYQRDGIKYLCGDVTRISIEGNFHCVVLSNVLEHIERRVEFLKSIYENMSPPPMLFIRVPMITRDWITLYKQEWGIEHRLDKTHFIEYRLEQIFEEVSKAGLEIKEYSIRFGEFYGAIGTPTLLT